MISRLRRATQIALIVAIALVTLGGPAGAADPSTGLAEAESRVASAKAEIASSQAQLNAARARVASTSRRADPAAKAARAARAQAREVRTSLLARQQKARAQISALEADHRQEVEDHDREVAYGIGIGLALLVGAGIALAWGWFRSSAPVAALSRLDLTRALALCLGGGFLLLLIGAAMADAGGFSGTIGALILGLGLVLPTALLLGRHSTEVERGNAKPVLKRERVPAWVPRGLAALLLLVALTGLGSSIFAEQPEDPSVSAQLRDEADALKGDPGARQLATARAEAVTAQEEAATPLAEQRAARAALRRATRAVRTAQNRLIEAEGDERRFVRLLAELEAREEREAARAEAQAEREAEELEEEEFEEPAPSGCDPNYSGCVPTYPPDVDCAEVGETVSVYGSDPHGLDADGDLEGCE